MDLANDTLEGVDVTDDDLKGADVINCAYDEKYDLQILAVPATCYVDPSQEGIQWRDLAQIELRAQMNHNSLSLKLSHDRPATIQVLPRDQK